MYDREMVGALAYKLGFGYYDQCYSNEQGSAFPHTVSVNGAFQGAKGTYIPLPCRILIEKQGVGELSS